jgi:hypothetical protein
MSYKIKKLKGSKSKKSKQQKEKKDLLGFHLDTHVENDFFCECAMCQVSRRNYM